MEERDIQIKKQLIEKAKELASNVENKGIYKELSELRRSWRSSRDDMSFYEQELQDEFDKYIDEISSKISATSKDAEAKKSELVAKAKELLNSQNIKKASNEMKELFEEWKVAGRADKEKDEELWNEFKTIRDEFYANRDAYYENLKNEFAANEQAKLQLIQEAVEANKQEDIKKLTEDMNSLMERWKQVRSASKEKDDELWNEFKAQRKIFFDKKNSYYEQMKSVFAQRAEEKKEIITQARRCLARSEFTDEEVNTMTELRNKWKEIGSAGRENENSLWEEFKSIVNKYNENMKFYR